MSNSTSHDELVPRPSPADGFSTDGSGADWQRHLRAEGTPSALPEIRQVVVDAAESCGFDAENVIKLEMAVGEACTNIIEHAYSTQPIRHDIDLELLCYPNRLEVVIQDYSSINFAVGDTQTYEGIDDWISTGRRRGLGIYIIQSFVDKVEHRFVCGQGNELRLTKYFLDSPS